MTARVLILDEDPVWCDLYRTTLDGQGYTIITASTLPDIETVIDLQPDLILLDHFRGSTAPGWIFLIQLKTFAETEHIPVVVCTADHEAVNAQIYDLVIFNVNVVYKPFDPNDFRSTIRYSLPSERVPAIAAHALTRNVPAPSYTCR
ncbi:MAG TPA: response regulator [Herpetosiphonaceae bacterium]